MDEMLILDPTGGWTPWSAAGPLASLPLVSSTHRLAGGPAADQGVHPPGMSATCSVAGPPGEISAATASAVKVHTSSMGCVRRLPEWKMPTVSGGQVRSPCSTRGLCWENHFRRNRNRQKLRD